MKIFLSYSHKDKEKADLIDNILLQKGFDVIRDTRNVKPWDDIYDFMNKISQDDIRVVPIVSDAFLKSVNCMYEMVVAMRDRQYKDKICPFLVIEDLFDSIDKQFEYITFWENQVNIFKKALDGINKEHRYKYKKKYNKYVDISDTMPDFLDFLEDFLCPKITKIDIIEVPGYIIDHFHLNEGDYLENDIVKNGVIERDKG